MINPYLGRLTNEVSISDVGDGKKVLNNRLAIRLSKNQTTFIDIVAWDGTAELINKYFKKGFEILFQGKLINKKKLIANGIEVEGNAILVDEVIFTYGNKRDNFVDNSDMPEQPDFL